MAISVSWLKLKNQRPRDNLRLLSNAVLKIMRQEQVQPYEGGNCLSTLVLKASCMG